MKRMQTDSFYNVMQREQDVEEDMRARWEELRKTWSRVEAERVTEPGEELGVLFEKMKRENADYQWAETEASKKRRNAK